MQEAVDAAPLLPSNRLLVIDDIVCHVVLRPSPFCAPERLSVFNRPADTARCVCGSTCHCDPMDSVRQDLMRAVVSYIRTGRCACLCSDDSLCIVPRREKAHISKYAFYQDTRKLRTSACKYVFEVSILRLPTATISHSITTDNSGKFGACIPLAGKLLLANSLLVDLQLGYISTVVPVSRISDGSLPQEQRQQEAATVTTPVTQARGKRKRSPSPRPPPSLPATPSKRGKLPELANLCIRLITSPRWGLDLLKRKLHP
ncbi:hypothetical protein RI367_001488 [Sorochytrium milnesiophthora]